MPLTGPQRISLARLLGHLREDWHDAGTHSAVTTLSDQAGTPTQLCQQALHAAGIAANLTPTAILWRDQHTPVLEQDAECPAHSGTTRRPDGTWACCWADTAEPQPFRRQSVTPPPADFRARVQAAKNATRTPVPANTRATPDRAPTAPSLETT